MLLGNLRHRTPRVDAPRLHVQFRRRDGGLRKRQARGASRSRGRPRLRRRRRPVDRRQRRVDQALEPSRRGGHEAVVVQPRRHDRCAEDLRPGDVGRAGRRRVRGDPARAAAGDQAAPHALGARGRRSLRRLLLLSEVLRRVGRALARRARPGRADPLRPLAGSRGVLARHAVLAGVGVGERPVDGGPERRGVGQPRRLLRTHAGPPLPLLPCAHHREQRGPGRRALAIRPDQLAQPPLAGRSEDRLGLLGR